VKIDPKAFKKGLHQKKRDMFHVEHGDNLAILKKLNPNQFDSLVTDPPAGIGFMGKDWDKDKGDRDNWIAWLRDILHEAMRVLKPGAYGVVWSLPRTSHWTAMAIEDAGFDVRDCIMHVFGQGFPKSRNISKDIDDLMGAEREAVGFDPVAAKRTAAVGTATYGDYKGQSGDVTLPSTPEAKKWDGFGTALKPAHEMWWLIQKPIAEDTIAENVLKHGVGGLNIDASRVGTASDKPARSTSDRDGRQSHGFMSGIKADLKAQEEINSKGRFPSNFLMTHSPGCVRVGDKKVKGSNDPRKSGGVLNSGGMFGVGENKRDVANFNNLDGTETVEAWDCDASCPVRLMDEQSGVSKSTGGKPKNNNERDLRMGRTSGFGATAGGIGDTGTASRYFKTFEADPFYYCAKPSPGEKNEGLEDLPKHKNVEWPQSLDGNDKRGSAPSANFHPTVKSVKLMQYLIKLVTPPGGTVLDPFMGSGTTGVAAIKNGFKFFGIDQEKQYTELAIGRLMGVYRVDPKLFKKGKVKNGDTPKDGASV
jgi:DNA modification methylase